MQVVTLATDTKETPAEVWLDCTKSMVSLSHSSHGAGVNSFLCRGQRGGEVSGHMVPLHFPLFPPHLCGTPASYTGPSAWLYSASAGSCNAATAMTTDP